MNNDYEFSDYAPGQWWLTALEKGEMNSDLKRALSIALNFARTSFAHVAQLEAEIARLKAQVSEPASASSGDVPDGWVKATPEQVREFHEAIVKGTLGHVHGVNVITDAFRDVKDKAPFRGPKAGKRGKRK